MFLSYFSKLKVQNAPFVIGTQELADEYGDIDDSAVDAEGPTPLMYRYSRRKSDSRSDENSQSSKSFLREVYKFECAILLCMYLLRFNFAPS